MLTISFTMFNLSLHLGYRSNYILLALYFISCLGNICVLTVAQMYRTNAPILIPNLSRVQTRRLLVETNDILYS